MEAESKNTKSESEPSKPVPTPNPETQPFWEQCAQRKLSVQECAACGHKQHYPRLLCTACSSTKVAQIAVSGKGSIASFTVNRVPVSSAFSQDVPYAVALVELEEGPTMMANITTDDLAALHIGMAVEVHFEERGDITLPQFKPT